MSFLTSVCDVTNSYLATCRCKQLLCRVLMHFSPLTKTAEIVPCLSSQKAAKGHCSAIMGKFECACGSCLGIVGAILLLGCISLTNVYAQAYEPERSSNLARIAGRYLLTGIFLAVLAVGACAGAKAGVAVACGVCLYRRDSEYSSNDLWNINCSQCWEKPFKWRN